MEKFFYPGGGWKGYMLSKREITLTYEKDFMKK